MQMFFLKNMVSVSIAALLFSATISLGTMADQRAAPPTPEETLKPNLASNNAETLIKSHSVEEGPDSTLYQEMIEGELNSIEAPEDTPESRVQERFNLLKEDARVGVQNPVATDEASNLNDSTQLEAVPPIAEQEVVPSMPEAETSTSETETVTVVSEDEALGVSPEAQPTMFESDTVEVVPQEPMLEPDTSGDLSDQGMPMQIPNDDAETSTSTQMQYKIIKPEVIMAPKPGDQKGSGPWKKQDEHYGPGAKGQSKGGRQKGQRYVEQQTDPKIIPIIRMGENLQESSGFTIIKPWNS